MSMCYLYITVGQTSRFGLGGDWNAYRCDVIMLQPGQEALLPDEALEDEICTRMPITSFAMATRQEAKDLALAWATDRGHTVYNPNA